ncbi:MAG TPA: fused MFS/spermidine synthase, partial [Thermoanaerobaculia bacterium]|nr:fused MFS/spermidine synthase [Thermoanaerobaculia bacterium]
MASTRPALDRPRDRIPALTPLVFLSGAAALVYEVLWARQLATLLGTSSHAQALVVAAYMAGLALGARALGPLADRVRRPFLLIAALESGIAAYAIAGTWLLPSLGPAWAGAAAGLGSGAAAQLARFALALAVLLPPTILMGATLPALVRATAADRESAGHAAGRIYGANTLGAAAGALLAGYALLPALGVRGSTLAAAGVQALVAVAFVALGSRLGDTDKRAQPNAAAAARTATGGTPSGASRPARRGDRDRSSAGGEPSGMPLPRAPRGGVLVLFAATGFLALAAQMAWVRALTLVIGSSVYAFAATLAVYLLGLGTGAALAAWALQRSRRAIDASRAVWLLVVLELGMAASILLGLPALRALPPIFLAGWEAGANGSFVLLQLLWLLLAAIVMLVPTALSGALLPAVVAACSGGADRLGRDTGAVYAANTSGTVLGAPVAALALLPALGVARTLVVLGIAHAVLALGFATIARGLGGSPAFRRSRRLLWLGAAVALLLALAAGRWDRRLMTSGPYINA